MTKEYYYINSYCNRNFGDDMFIISLIKRYPNASFYVCASKSILPKLNNYSNIKYESEFSFIIRRIRKKLLNIPGRVRNERKLKNAKAVIKIGGSIFIEYNGWDKNYYVDSNKNNIIIGANFGPYDSQRYYEASKMKIENALDCCFRDKYSLSLFSDIPHVRYAPDILFGYDYSMERKDEYIGVSVINYDNRVDKNEVSALYEDGILKICNHYIKQHKKIKLLGFCKNEGDQLAIERIIRKAGNNKDIVSVIYDGDIDNFLDEINTCGIIYATRFHAMIIGWSMKKEVIPIVYSQKQLHVMDDILFDKPFWNLLDKKTIPPECFDVHGSQLSDERIAWLKLSSNEHFQFLDKQINMKHL